MRSKYRAGLSGPLLLLMPMAAQAAPPPLDAYGDLPRVEDIAISPDGTSTANVLQVSGGRRVFVVKDGKPLLNAASGPNKVRGIEWADNDTVLLTNSATVPLFGFAASKYEFSGTIIVPMKPGGVSGLVFGKSKDVADTTRGRYGIRTVGGQTVGYFGGIAMEVDGMSTHFKHGRTTLYAVDLKTNRARQAAPAPEENHYRDWLIDAAGNVAIVLDISETDGTWKIGPPRGRELVRGIDPTGHVSLIAFGKDGTSVIYQIEDDDGNERWYEVPMTGGEPKGILNDIGIERIFVDRSTGNMIGYRTSGEKRQTVMNDPVHQHALTRIFKAFDGREVDLIDWTPDFSKVILRTSGSKDSGTWFLVDVAQRRADPIADERPEIMAEQVGPISKIDYAAADGLKMDGILTLPPGREAKGLPVILLPHGGPASHDTPDFDWWAQAFASRGYAVFQPNFRGSTGGTDAFRHAGDGEWGRKMQTDISDGLAELAKRGLVDPRRACIVGASYGGYAALAGVTLQQGLYRCAVSVAGVADLKLMYSTDIRESGDSKMLGKVLREQLGDPKRYYDVSPRRFAARADAPVLLIHGKDDTVVPYKQSQVMADALKDAGKPYEMVTLAGEDHWLSRAETRKKMLSETMRFVEKNNPAD
ncbi:S9 family peptidase [Novosphingobium sp. AP12]|uniref:alpha/beta hydrolase family protein n=1 Tax=Novosphingobium sp. AP12 TaxID=1144305 RepID=UPI000271F112|nr:S9 family peptidase [Novosphingobium sp. AP12]EJL34278.1 dipeptidyl aminopeptidase/acylaminoacyl peptidase [Novosphingobium sp. AP12]